MILLQIAGILLNASTSPDENDAIDIEMQCDMLFLVASLCEGDTHRKVIILKKRLSECHHDRGNWYFGLSH